MGWFWADVPPKTVPSSKEPSPRDINPPPGCPMHKPSKLNPATSQSIPESTPVEGCPYVPPGKTPSTSQRPSPASTIAALNPLNYMPFDLSQRRESSAQQTPLSVERETSSIPRGGDEGAAPSNWIYPSPQQMYNAMLRKGYTDTPEDAVESMVAIHNFLNEGAWAEIVEWERRFGRGLAQGWHECRYGEAGSHGGAMIEPTRAPEVPPPTLVRFMGRADDLTPKARALQLMGWMFPEKYGGPAPFDRHDWFVERMVKGGHPREVRYVIDYYSAPPEPTGEPVFYLDIRPALDGPTAAAERLMRWGRDVWWRASGAAIREGWTR